MLTGSMETILHKLNKIKKFVKIFVQIFNFDHSMSKM